MSDDKAKHGKARAFIEMAAALPDFETSIMATAESPATPKLTDETAEALLRLLSAHYGEPVQPIGRYCEALQTWERALSDRSNRAMEKRFPGLLQDMNSEDQAVRQAAWDRWNALPSSERKIDDDLAGSVRHVFMQIRKSNLLARLLYNGEALRTQLCPVHLGRWSGIEGFSPDSQCTYGCQLTGWLPEPADVGKPLPGVRMMMCVAVPEGEHVSIRDEQGVELARVRAIKP